MADGDRNNTSKRNAMDHAHIYILLFIMKPTIDPFCYVLKHSEIVRWFRYSNRDKMGLRLDTTVYPS